MGRRIIFRTSGGRFRRAPSLAELGYPVATGGKTCGGCGHLWYPILVTGRCPKCDSSEGTVSTPEEARDG
jgi:predicted Zn-ribbon and HTH transcriptional regulator